MKRVILVARASAAALVFVPVLAGFEAAGFESTQNAVPSAAARRIAQTFEDPGFEKSKIGPATSLPVSADETDPNSTARADPAQSPAPFMAFSDTICAVLGRSASQSDLPIDFFTRLIWQESRFNPQSISRAGAQGIAQFMPGTAREVGLNNPFDPIVALPKSAELLRDLRTQFGNLGLAAAAYNAGPKRVQDWLMKRQPLPRETQAYVRIITGRSAQEWTSVASGTWEMALPAPAPCEQLTATLQLNPLQRVAVAADQPDRPSWPAILLHQPVIIVHQAGSIRCCHSPRNGIKLTHLMPDVISSKSIVHPRLASRQFLIRTRPGG